MPAENTEDNCPKQTASTRRKMDHAGFTAGYGPALENLEFSESRIGMDVQRNQSGHPRKQQYGIDRSIADTDRHCARNESGNDP